MLFQSTLLLSAIACALANEPVIRRSVRSEFGAAEQLLYSTKDFGHRSKRDSNSNSTNESSFDFNRIETNAKQIVYSDHPNVVLVLGNTGTGKSTLVQLIAGNNSNMRSERICPDPNECPGNDYKIIDMNGIIGQSSVYSHTSIPQLVFDVKTNTSIYDCPGFSDTRSAEYDISGAYFIRKITNRAKKIKFLFVVNYSDLTVIGNRIGFGTLLTHVTSLFKNVDKFKDSFAIVANKVDKTDLTDKQVVAMVAYYMRKYRNELNNQTEQNAADQKKKVDKVGFINALLAQNGEDYPKIGFLRTPKEPGPLSNISAIQDNKRLLLHLLHNNIHYSQQSSRDYGYPISDETKIYIHGSVDKINENLTSRIDNVATKLQEYYNNLSKDILRELNTISDNDFVGIRSLISRFIKGYDSILALIEKINNVTTLQIVLNMINETVTQLDRNIIQDNIFNVSVEIQAVEFLQDISGYESRPYQEKWKSSFGRVIIDVDKIKINIHDNVTHKVDYLKSEINSKVKNSGIIIQKYFSTQEETVWNIQNLSHVIESEYRKLEGTHKKVYSLSETKKCIEQMSKVIENTNIDNVSRISVKNTLSNITRYGDFLNFLYNPNNQSPSRHTFKCTEGLGDVLEFLRNSKEWYSFLISFYKELSKFKTQNNRARWKKFADDIIYTNNVKSVADIRLDPFLKEFFFQNLHENIKSIVIDKSKFNTLRKVLDLTLTEDLNSECIPDASNDLKLTIKGQFIKLSDISEIESKCQSTPKSIEIFALNKIFIDTDFHKKDKTVELSIIAPTWDIEGRRKIVLDGKSGNAHNPLKKPSVNNCSETTHGLPGEPGESGGAFLGIGAVFNGAEDLSISANGGNGGPGQHGGDGKNGEHATYYGKIEISNMRKVHVEDLPECECHWEPEKPNRLLLQSGIKNCTGLFNNHRFEYTDDDRPTVNHYSWIIHDTRYDCDGCSGGNGGIGGEEGYAGNITMIVLRNDAYINYSAYNGTKGSDGIGGKHGVGGKYGKTLHMTYASFSPITYLNRNGFPDEEWYEEKYKQCPSGKPGIDGSKLKKERNSKQGVTFSQPSDPIIKYKSYVIQYLENRSITDSDLKDFSKLLGSKL